MHSTPKNGFSPNKASSRENDGCNKAIEGMWDSPTTVLGKHMPEPCMSNIDVKPGLDGTWLDCAPRFFSQHKNYVKLRR